MNKAKELSKLLFMLGFLGVKQKRSNSNKLHNAPTKTETEKTINGIFGSPYVVSCRENCGSCIYKAKSDAIFSTNKEKIPINCPTKAKTIHLILLSVVPLPFF